MPLPQGTRFGPYEIAAPLGAGGMGEVYRARDSRLGRDVAIKVLAAHLSANAEVRSRFEREARAVSSLNHPHICVLHDVGREGDTDFLVMELVEGETLADRLTRGAIPASEVLKLGVQVADALDWAHRAGVIHRDLKPGNIMLTKSGAKLMDFGLARAVMPSDPGGATGSGPGSLSQSPTMAQPLTAEGTIVGTFQYMAPELLEGKEADSRSDLWSLGCVLYEMLTGERAFDGRSQASLISSIMKDEPRPITERAPMSPPALDRLVKGCLAKDPADRVQTAHDVRLQLEWIAEAGSQAGVPAPLAARRRVRERVAWVVAGVTLVAAIGLGALALQARVRTPEAIQVTVTPPDAAPLDQYACNVTISPDGRTIAFGARDSSGRRSLWVRPLASVQAREISGTDAAIWPFWSPDGKFIAYFDQVNEKLVKVGSDGGRPTIVCDASNGRGGSWSRDGTIVFAPAPEGPLMRVAAGGGEVAPATALDSTHHETAHRFPCFLPDGDHFLFSALPGGPNGWDVCVGSLRSRSVRRLTTAQSAAVYAEPGYLLFERNGRVLAQRFDPRRLAFAGDAMPIADAPAGSDLDAEPVAFASRNRRLALLRSEPPESRVQVLDRTGAERSSYDLPPAPWVVGRVAPDGRRAAIRNGEELWILDLSRSVPMRIASGPASEPSVAWSPDGRHLAHVTWREGREEIFLAGMDGKSEWVPTTPDQFKFVCDWSRDGRNLVFGVLDPRTALDLWRVSMEGQRKAEPYLQEPGYQTGGSISPDGRWIAYQSNETGSVEIYVQSFPVPGHKTRVSRDGGFTPFWTHGGRELVYRQGEQVVAVPMEAGDEPRPGTPHALFTLPRGAYAFQMLDDGERVLASVPTRSRPRDIRVILDWPALLGR